MRVLGGILFQKDAQSKQQAGEGFPITCLLISTSELFKENHESIRFETESSSSWSKPPKGFLFQKEEYGKPLGLTVLIDSIQGFRI